MRRGRQALPRQVGRAGGIAGLDFGGPVRPAHPARKATPVLSAAESIRRNWLGLASVGRPVVALTADTASIRNPETGAVTVYRKHNKPCYGPLGDSLDDLDSGGRE